MSTTAARLPMPDWSRPGETWRVMRENDWHLVGREHDWPCIHRACFREPVAWVRKPATAFCELHLNQGLMWLENGQVVSWYLSRPA